MVNRKEVVGMDYESPKELLTDLYAELRNLRYMEDELNVSWPTIAAKMDKLGVGRRHLDVPSIVAPKIAGIPGDKLKTMTSHEIAEKVGCTLSWALVVLKRQGRVYRRQRQKKAA